MNDQPVNQYSPLHPHEPGIPPVEDSEGRCLVCGLLVEHNDCRAESRALRDLLRRAVKYAPYGFAMWPHELRAEIEAALAEEKGEG